MATLRFKNLQQDHTATTAITLGVRGKLNFYRYFLQEGAKFLNPIQSCIAGQLLGDRGMEFRLKQTSGVLTFQ